MKGPGQEYLDALLEIAEDPDHGGRDLAIFNLYLAACNANRLLADHQASIAARDDKAGKCVAELGRLITEQPTGQQKSAFYQAVTKAGRDAR